MERDLCKARFYDTPIRAGLAFLGGCATRKSVGHKPRPNEVGPLVERKHPPREQPLLALGAGKPTLQLSARSLPRQFFVMNENWDARSGSVCWFQVGIASISTAMALAPATALWIKAIPARLFLRCMGLACRAKLATCTIVLPSCGSVWRGSWQGIARQRQL